MCEQAIATNVYLSALCMSLHAVCLPLPIMHSMWISYRWGTLVHLLEFQLRVVLETTSENYPIQSEDFLAGDGSYQESCNRLYLLLSTFEGSVCFNLSYYIYIFVWRALFCEYKQEM